MSVKLLWGLTRLPLLGWKRPRVPGWSCPCRSWSCLFTPSSLPPSSPHLHSFLTPSLLPLVTPWSLAHYSLVTPSPPLSLVTPSSLSTRHAGSLFFLSLLSRHPLFIPSLHSLVIPSLLPLQSLITPSSLPHHSLLPPSSPLPHSLITPSLLPPRHAKNSRF